jgi:hypothetical protein
LSAGDKAPFELILTSASIPIKEIDNYSLSLDWQKGVEKATTTVLPSDFGLNNIVKGNENFVEKQALILSIVERKLEEQLFSLQTLIALIMD